MLLKIKRNQAQEEKKGVFGGSSINNVFRISIRLEISQEEEAFIKKYGFSNYVFSWRKNSKGEDLPEYELNDLIKGIELRELDYVSDLLKKELEIRERFERFNNSLSIYGSFDGEDAIEYIMVKNENIGSGFKTQFVRVEE